MADNLPVKYAETSIDKIETLGDIENHASILVRSGYFTEKTVSQLMAKIMIGRALGMDIYESMTQLHITPAGKPGVNAQYIASQIRQNPLYDFKIIKADETGTVIEFFIRKERKIDGAFEKVWTEEFGPKQAQEMQYYNKKISKMEPVANKWTFKSMKSDMYYARCMARGARRCMPDALRGMPIYTKEELEGGDDFNGNAGKEFVTGSKKVNAEVVRSTENGDVIEADFTVKDDALTDSPCTFCGKRIESSVAYEPGGAPYHSKCLRKKEAKEKAAAKKASAAPPGPPPCLNCCDEQGQFIPGNPAECAGCEHSSDCGSYDGAVASKKTAKIETETTESAQPEQSEAAGMDIEDLKNEIQAIGAKVGGNLTPIMKAIGEKYGYKGSFRRWSKIKALIALYDEINNMVPHEVLKSEEPPTDATPTLPGMGAPPSNFVAQIEALGEKDGFKFHNILALMEMKHTVKAENWKSWPDALREELYKRLCRAHGFDPAGPGGASESF